MPWTGFDLINTFNAWKKTEYAGRVFTVDTEGTTDTVVTGLAWRDQVCQQVFEEAAVDLGKGLKAWSDSRSGKRKGRRIGFPRFKKKTGAVPSFRLRNKHPKDRPPAIRVGDNDRPRSITLPGIGPIGVHDDTRRLRRMLAKDRAKILFATITHHGGRWWVSLNVEAAELHPAHQHPPRDRGRSRRLGRRGSRLVGVPGRRHQLTAPRSPASATPPKRCAAGMERQRRLAKSLSRKQKGSHNRRDAAAKLGRHHHHVANVRRHFLHQVSNALVKTHDRLVIERPQRVRDAGQPPPGPSHLRCRLGRVRPHLELQAGLARRRRSWSPTAGTRRASSARPAVTVRGDLTLADRVFTCGCGHSADRDRNAAVNLARWGQTHHDPHRSPDPQATGPGHQRPPTGRR